MKYQYLFILESDTDLGNTDNPEMEISLKDFLPTKCYGKMDSETFEREWNNGTRLVNQEMEMKEDFFGAFKPFMESMVEQGVIITNPDGTYSQRPSSKSMMVNLAIDSLNHFLTNFKVEAEMEDMKYKQAKKLLEKHESTWNQFALSEIDYGINKSLVEHHEPSFFNSFKGQMIVKSVNSLIPMIAEYVKGEEPEADIRLDPVQFFECFERFQSFFNKYMDRMMHNSPEVLAMFKSMNIPIPKISEHSAKILKLEN